MYAKEVNDSSPLRILEKSIHGGLGKGNLGVVMARAGVGKTACLVQIGLDDLMRGRDVLHVALGQTLEHVQSWYDALFDDLAQRTGLEEREVLRAELARHRVIKTYGDHVLPPERLEKAIAMFQEHLGFQPAAILIDGYDWTGGKPRDPGQTLVPVTGVAAQLGAFKGIAKRLGCELWITAQTHRTETGRHPTQVTAPCAPYVGLIDVAVYLEPGDHHVWLRLLKDHGDAVPPDTHLVLHADTMRIVTEEEDRRRPTLPPAAFTLLSGGAPGAEAEFGACAEKHGLAEMNFTFVGRPTERTRGLYTLSESELRQGDVSSSYLRAHMHRKYPETPLFRKVLQSIWHQVSSAGQVFCVGVIQPDDTVKGGTGWAAELARHWTKPVHVYDQEKKGWFAWDGGKWAKEDAPLIQKTRFTGTGTRFLTDDGREAIRSLFERSFG
ncbi:MAG TPA: hypothetical protein VKE22_27310 [Haliangiales bacterium]|nr:hypothetical protein [Haliangiales bacterium]